MLDRDEYLTELGFPLVHLDTKHELLLWEVESTLMVNVLKR